MLEAYSVAALYYLLMTTLWGQAQRLIERAVNKPYVRAARGMAEPALR